jgi:hypothetical protein
MGLTTRGSGALLCGLAMEGHSAGLVEARWAARSASFVIVVCKPEHHRLRVDVIHRLR